MVATTSIAVYDWEESGRSLATATLPPGEKPYLPGHSPNFDPMVIQDSARIILERLTLNPTLEGQTFDGSFRFNQEKYFFKIYRDRKTKSKTLDSGDGTPSRSKSTHKSLR
ncbi:MAG: hypothetical protein HC796_11515 [Synechococcaceae cyanobacterium RL_1_2]|nr:hypothetical protein [Synechococcaceae cyanobacterium RL_1_2]